MRDRVTSELHAAILLRDRRCVLSFLQEGHVCRDQWGMTHDPADLGRLSIEHVHDGYGRMGKRAPSDMAHLVALCGGANVGVPSKVQRQAMRAYLESVGER